MLLFLTFWFYGRVYNMFLKSSILEACYCYLFQRCHTLHISIIDTARVLSLHGYIYSHVPAIHACMQTLLNFSNKTYFTY